MLLCRPRCPLPSWAPQPSEHRKPPRGRGRARGSGTAWLTGSAPSPGQRGAVDRQQPKPVRDQIGTGRERAKPVIPWTLLQVHLPEAFSRRNTEFGSHRNLSMNIRSSFIRNSQTLETAQPSFSVECFSPPRPTRPTRPPAHRTALCGKLGGSSIRGQPAGSPGGDAGTAKRLHGMIPLHSCNRLEVTE